MKYGDELEIRLVDSTGHAYYTEPFDLEMGGSHSNFESALEIFRSNADDALGDIITDVEADAKLKNVPEANLIAAIRNRGYEVKKKDTYAPSRACGCAQ